MGDGDSANPHSNPTGLDFIHDSSNPVEPLTKARAREFAAQALLTSATRGRYWQVETLTLWQAFALYCYLDPDVLGAPTLTRLNHLREVARYLSPVHPLSLFCHELWLVSPEMSSVLPLREKKHNWYDSTITPLSFRAHLQSRGLQVSEPRGVLYHLPVPEKFSCLRLAIETYAQLCDCESRPGHGDPRNKAVTEFVRKRGGSGALGNAIARVLSPDVDRRGRPKEHHYHYHSPGSLSSALTPDFFKYVDEMLERHHV